MLLETMHACNWRNVLGDHQHQRHCQEHCNVCGRKGKQAACQRLNSSILRLATLLVKNAVDDAFSGDDSARNSP